MLIEDTTPAQGIHTASPARSIPLWLIAIVVGIIALLPRTIGLNDFYTIDEGYHWPGRVERFSEALRTADWAATNQTGHPGVTTMWLGSLGRWFAYQLGVTDPGWAGGGATYLAFLRLPLAITNSLAVVIGFLLLRRLMHPHAALVAALLWATSPFLIAHSRLLHLDALLTSFMTLSILLLLVGFVHGKHVAAGPQHPADGISWRFLVGSGVFGGLALLTKAPSLILLPFAGLAIFFLSYSKHQKAAIGLAAQLRELVFGRWMVVLPRYIAWLGVAALVVVVCWPAMWVTPFVAAGDVALEIIQNGGQPHHSGNYFLGQPVADPGLLFYPAVVLWRTTPLTLIGLVALIGVAIAWLGSMIRNANAIVSDHNRIVTPADIIDRASLLALIGFVVLFGVLMAAQAKKLDRYLLPVWPALEILAAVGLTALWRYLTQVWQVRNKPSPLLTARLSQFGMPVLAVLFGLPLALYHPYYLAYFNPLLGGGPVAERVMLVGLGEGMDQVGAWLRTRPDLKRGDVLSWTAPNLAPFVPKEVLVRDLRPEFLLKPSSYAVLYIRSVQHKESAEAEAYVRQSPALHTVRINGIEYATIHQLPRAYSTPIGAVFGDRLHLRGFSHTLLNSTLVITPSWDIQQNRAGGVFTFIHVLNANGEKVGQVDAMLDQGMFSAWQAGQQFDEALPIPLMQPLAPGSYRVVMGVYEPSGRLALTQGIALPESIDGPHAIELMRFTIS